MADKFLTVKPPTDTQRQLIYSELWDNIVEGVPDNIIEALHLTRDQYPGIWLMRLGEALDNYNI